MAGVITSTSFAKALFPGVSSWYGTKYDEFEVECKDLFDVHASRLSYEEDVGTSGFGLAQEKPEGQAVAYDDATQAFITRYSHTVFALGFVITREMVEDDLYDVIGKRKSEALAFSMRQTKENVCSNVYNRAFNPAYLGGDGVCLLNNAHPNFAGGTQSNVLAVAADLSEAGLEQACIDIQKWTDDRGLRINYRPQTLHIPVDLEFEAERILKTPYRVGTANNDMNALHMMGKIPGGVKINHYFTDTNAWFLRTNAPDSMKLYERRGAEFTIDNDFDTENAKYKATERYVPGWTDYRGLFGTAGA
jgi:hypothetical protein